MHRQLEALITGATGETQRWTEAVGQLPASLSAGGGSGAMCPTSMQAKGSRMRWLQNGDMVGRAALLLFLATLVAGRRLSEKCSGYSPEDCSNVPGCKTCWDGRRMDCFQEDQATYGNFWCENRAPNDACSGKSEADCGASRGCVFCKSAAVGNQCYTTEDAKKLPSAVFSCSWPSAY